MAAAAQPLFPTSFDQWKRLLKRAYADWSKDQAPRLGASLAYYTALSLAPLLILLLALAGFIFGDEAARGQLYGQISGMMGSDSAKTIEEMIKNASKPSSGILASIIGLVTLIIGASSVAGELRASFNTVWNKPYNADAGIKDMVKERSYALVVVLGCGFLLLVSLVVSSFVAGAGTFAAQYLPLPEFVLHLLNIVLSIAVVTGVFAALFKYLPDVDLEWRQVISGAVLTAVLFTIGKFAIGMYLGKAGIGSTYGAAGSLVVLLVWVYYSAQILFFGAEFTQVYACETGSTGVCPSDEKADVSKGKTNASLPKPGKQDKDKAPKEQPAAGYARDAAAGNAGLTPVAPGPAGRATTVTGTIVGAALAGLKVFRLVKR
ncbi:MAG TPA: YihY/virulence factor BrkB family protein [Bryobacteraceae bacterium]|nr:YihY/virulence factor BrkB family protein [Bryobacteraceae bacterium]